MARAAIPVSIALAVAAFAVGEDDGYAQGRAGWGAFVVPVPLRVQADRGLVPGQGGLVLWVRPGGTAAGMGVQRGDVVLSINDRPVSSRRDIRDVVRTAAPGDEATVRTINADGGAETLSGAFRERRPRPPGGWGGPPDGWRRPEGWGGPMGAGDPADIVARQYEELLREQRELREIAEQVRIARAQLAAADGDAWVMRAQLRIGAAEAVP